MRPKVTFRDGRLKQAAWGVPRYPDAWLDPVLADSLAMWRSKYLRFNDRATNPNNQDIKATLAALAELPDSELDEAMRHIDLATHCHLKRAAYLNYRSNHPAGRIPPGALALRRADVRVRVAVIVQPIKHLAKLALDTFPMDTGGAPKISALDHFFAMAVVAHWTRLKPGSKPVCRKAGNDFTDFAEAMFDHVGRKLKPTSLERVLGKAIKEVARRN